MINILHSGNIGDCIYSLPAMRKASRNAGQNIHLYLCINQPGQLAPGHPAGNVMISETIANMAVPLFESLDFIGQVTITDDPKTQVDYNFNRFREIGFHYTGHIARWQFYTYPELTCDLSEPIFIQGKEPQGITFNRTSRYHGEGFEYLFLRPWANQMTFLGTPDEFYVIKKKLPGMEYYGVKDFLEMAQMIKSSQLFIGGQSMAFALAEIMKVPRILEVCRWAHNVIPQGPNGYDCLNIETMYDTVKKLIPVHAKAQAN